MVIGDRKWDKETVYTIIKIATEILNIEILDIKKKNLN